MKELTQVQDLNLLHDQDLVDSFQELGLEQALEDTNFFDLFGEMA